MNDRREAGPAQLKLRVPEAVRLQLEAAAQANDRPLNKEVVHRLEESLRHDAALGDAQTAAVLRVLGGMVDAAQQKTGKYWLEDAATFKAARKLIDVVLTTIVPEARRQDSEAVSDIADEMAGDMTSFVKKDLSLDGIEMQRPEGNDDDASQDIDLTASRIAEAVIAEMAVARLREERM